ncbi:hypothetical protein HacjB3_16601 (plasmid) [Halalkalicoccus jeotgali B3]|nr:hypothetical protein HacjB3_16601 [Halalkalicoccus jeotgali B3]
MAATGDRLLGRRYPVGIFDFVDRHLAFECLVGTNEGIHVGIEWVASEVVFTAFAPPISGVDPAFVGIERDRSFRDCLNRESRIRRLLVESSITVLTIASSRMTGIENRLRLLSGI